MKNLKPVKNIFGDVYFEEVNGQKFKDIAYSTYFDVEILEQLSDEFTFYIFIGTDSGMLVNHIKQLNLDLSSIYFFIEEGNIISQISSSLETHNNIQNTLENLHITSLKDWEITAENTGIIKYIEVNRVKVIKSFSALENCNTEYLTIASILNNDLNTLKWYHPDKFQKKIYIERQLENCPFNTHPAIQLKDLFNNQPALILAAGPSLDKYIDWIEENQDKYIVIAVSRIAKRLLSTKIRPQIFVSADPYDSAYTTSKEVLEFCNTSILVYQAYAHPKLVKNWQGIKFYLGDLLPWKTNHQPSNITGIGPTVTNCAIHLAQQIGIGNQILFGVDLSFSKDGYTHVSETPEYEQGARLGIASTPITTNEGETAETTYEMMEARTSISVMANLASTRNQEIINPNPDSAKIEHVKHIPLSKIEVPEKKVSTLTQLLQTDHFYEHQLNNTVSQHYQSIKKEAEQLLDKTNEILNNIEQIQENITKISKNNDKNNNYKQTNVIEIDNIYHEIKNTEFIEHTGVNDFIDYIHPEHYKQKGEIEKKIIERYLISAYIASYQAQKKIKKLLDNISTEEKKLFHKNNLVKIHLKNKLQRHLESTETTEKKEINPRLEEIESKLFNYFINRETKSLYELNKQLENISSKDGKALHHLANGYLHEINDKENEALDEYLLADSHQTRESALKRILDISLKRGDTNNIIAVFNILSEISDEYLLELANLYQKSKMHKDALNTYSLYIEKNPEDILVLLRMALLYFSLNIVDGCRFVLEHIINIDSNNKTAIIYLSLINNQKINHKYKPNQLYIDREKYINRHEFDFFESVTNKKIDLKRLEQAERKGYIGFLAVSTYTNHPKFIKYIRTLLQELPETKLTIFFFKRSIKDSFKNTFKNFKDRIEYINPTSIYEIVENIEIYIDCCELQSNQYFIKKYLWLNNLIKEHCKNIYINKFIPKWINETLDETSNRLMNSPIDKKIKQLITTKNDISSSNEFLEHLFKKALNYNSNVEYTYKSNKLTNIEVIKLAIKHKNFIHFMFNYKKT